MIHGALIAAALGIAVIVAVVRRSRSRCSWQEWCEASQQWEQLRECPQRTTTIELGNAFADDSPRKRKAPKK